MTEPSLASQRAVAIALKAAPGVTGLVPADNIFDRSQHPERFPCIILGEGTTVDDSSDCIEAAEVSLDLHIWTRESGMVLCKQIAGAAMRALRGMDAVQDGVSISLAGQSATYLRDPSGEHAHGVLSLDILTDGDGE